MMCSNDENGTIIKEFMENKNLVCLNNGGGTNGLESFTDLTLVSDRLAAKCR